MLRLFALGTASVSPSAAVALLSTVQGLSIEAERVRAAFDEARPAAVALAASPESVAALLRWQPVADVDPFDDLADHEYLYAYRLRSYGPVGLPPPDLAEAARLAVATGAPVRGVDLTEEEYEETFTTEVGTFALLRYGRLQRSLARKPPTAPDARAFSLAWDAKVRRVKGIARVEARREEVIAQRARTLAAEVGGTVLLLVDAPREAGVARHLGAGTGAEQGSS